MKSDKKFYWWVYGFSLVAMLVKTEIAILVVAFGIFQFVFEILKILRGFQEWLQGGKASITITTVKKEK